MRPWLILTASVLAAVHLLLLLGVADRISPTQDEPLHLASGFSYWAFHDYRMQPENGALAQRWLAWPALFLASHPIDREDRLWRYGRQFELAIDFLQSNPPFLLKSGRWMVALLSVGLVCLVGWWARRNWGAAAGCFAMALAAGSPTVLAHGSLATSDMAMALAFLAASWALWQVIRGPTVVRVLAAGLLCAVTALCKYTAVALGPVAAAYLILHAIRQRKWAAEGAQSSLWPTLIRPASALLACGLVSWVTIWGAYGFRYSAFHPADAPGRFYHDWEALQTETGGSRLIALLKDHRVLPEAYLYGAEVAQAFSQTRAAYFLGEVRMGGWRHFFPVAFVLKSSPALLAGLAGLLAVGVLGVVRRRRAAETEVVGEWHQTAVLLIPATLYFLMAVNSNLNIGHRHILPVYPFLFILCGRLAAGRAWPAPKAALVLALALGQLAIALHRFPNYLSYFNFIGGGSPLGWHYLVDSSLDWGQDIYLVEDWERRHLEAGGELPGYLLFGPMERSHYDLEGRWIYQFSATFRWDSEFPPLDPGVYVVSATLLAGPYFLLSTVWTDADWDRYQTLRRLLLAGREESGQDPAAWLRFMESSAGIDWARALEHFGRMRAKRLCDYFRGRQPIERIGDTHFVYRLTPEDARLWGFDREFSLENRETLAHALHFWGMRQDEADAGTAGRP